MVTSLSLTVCLHRERIEEFLELLLYFEELDLLKLDICEVQLGQSYLIFFLLVVHEDVGFASVFLFVKGDVLDDYVFGTGWNLD